MVIDKKIIFDGGRFRQGLDRVAKVVEGTANYDWILNSNGHLDKDKYSQAISAHADGRIDELTKIISYEIRNSKIVCYIIPDGIRTISYGSTKNNKRELAFIARKLGKYVKTNICELTECKRIIKSTIGKLPISVEAERIVMAFVLERSMLTSSLLRQIFMYVSAYYSFLLSFSIESQFLKGLILANDHSPIPVALSMVGAQLGLCRVYLQHAEVTEIFPPLDFEYSILRNRKSENIYRSIGEVSGKVNILCRRNDLLNKDEMLRRVTKVMKSARVIVGLYPSSVYNETCLRKTVAALCANPSVNKVFLKPHPSLDLSHLASELKIDYCTQTPIEAHVSVVGNSSVALDLAMNGNLVFQLFELDSVGEDYYGFDSEGLTQKISVEEMHIPAFWDTTCFLTEFESVIMRRIEEERGEMPDDEDKYLRRLIIELGCNTYRPHIGSTILGGELSLFPGSTVNVLKSGKIYGNWESILQLNELFSERRINLSKLLPYFDLSVCNSVVDFWFISKAVEWNGQSLSEDKANNLLNFTEQIKSDRKTKKWIQSKLFDILLRTNNIAILKKFLDMPFEFSVMKASINQKIAYSRMLQTVSSDSIMLQYYNHLDDSLHPLDTLKINVQCEVRNNSKLLYANYRNVEKEFIKCVNKQLLSEYNILVRSVFTSIESRCNFIDVRRNSEQSEQLIKLITLKLRDRSPFSLIRLSDGEGYLFHKQYPFFTEDDALNRERHWWGEELDELTRNKIINLGLSAVNNADIICIPTIYRFLRDCSVQTKSFLKSTQGRGLISVLQGICDQASDVAEFGDDKLNITLFNRFEYLQPLLKSACKIIVINGAMEKVLIDVFNPFATVIPITIPTHNKTYGNNKFVSTLRPLPFTYERICERIELEAVPGTLVLVGAGVAGKTFIQSAKKAGAVGLDLGSALDQLVGAGIHSLH
jgi:hypothetical protein